MVGTLLAAAAVAVVQLSGVDRPRVVVAVPSASGQVERMMAAGLDRATRELGVDVQHLRDRSRDPVTRYRQLADAGADLVVIDSEDTGSRLEAMIAGQPDTQFAVIGAKAPPAGVRDVRFVDEQAGYLAGVAAATMTGTRAVGFVGDVQDLDNERLRAGFEAGVHSVDRDVTVHATYVGEVGAATSRTLNRANTAADLLYQRGADIVFAAAGDASSGVFEAALDHTLITGRDVWVIGAGQDWARVAPRRVRAQLRASVVPQWDVAVVETIRALTVDAPAQGPIELTAPGGALALVDDGTPRVTRAVEAAVDDIGAERVTVPVTPSGALNVPPSPDVTDVGTVRWGGGTCEADAVPHVDAGAVGRVSFVNRASTAQRFVVDHEREATLIATVVPPGARAVGYAVLRPGAIELGCASAMGERAGRDVPTGATVTVGAR